MGVSESLKIQRVIHTSHCFSLEFHPATYGRSSLHSSPQFLLDTGNQRQINSPFSVLSLLFSFKPCFFGGWRAWVDHEPSMLISACLCPTLVEGGTYGGRLGINDQSVRPATKSLFVARTFHPTLRRVN